MKKNKTLSAPLRTKHTLSKKSALGTLLQFCTSLLLFLVMAGAALAVSSALPALTEQVMAQTLDETLGEVNRESQLPGFGTGSGVQSRAHSEASYEPGADSITSAILFVVDLIKYLTGTIAVVVLIVSGFRLIVSARQVEEVSSQQKENIKYAIIALLIIIVADVFVRQVFFGEYGEVFRSEADAQLAAERGTDQIRGIYNFIEIFVAALAVFMIVVAGVRLVASGGSEDIIGKQKKQIGWAVAGLILIGLSELVVKDILFPEQGETLPDINRGRELIVNFTNFVSAFVATVAIAMFMYGGFLYITDAGKEESSGKAKKVFIGATIGLIIALAAYAIVNTFLAFEQPLP